VERFQEFLLKQNALALAVGVIIGAAIGKVVASLVADVLMPVIGLGMPGGDWRAAKIVLSESMGGGRKADRQRDQLRDVHRDDHRLRDRRVRRLSNDAALSETGAERSDQGVFVLSRDDSRRGDACRACTSALPGVAAGRGLCASVANLARPFGSRSSPLLQSFVPPVRGARL
jgi:hypothetical protein